ncbi:MAG: osmoprotectant transport system substrate-binding protein [Candidatus Electronema aureum]|uniref:Osmoprotectant transport system substrate-binding protein n=1 Tax=Candidatus Electronema aureum TaxID=2005002 RepID=A0A521G5K5_9BACT|nr:MAG: osmoprotectant transport system substrate-binding protein [Candidatus Electronema aureum]
MSIYSFHLMKFNKKVRKKMAQKLAALLSGTVLLTALTATPSYSCVGRILNLSIDGSAEQKAIGQLMATYINERTGTTVNLVENPESKDGSCTTDVCIQYLKPALASMGGEQPQDEQEAYTKAKEFYMENKNIVWLKPFAFKGPAAQQAEASIAVPVSPRDALGKFPVLDRVINKLSGMVNDATVQEMIQKSQGSDPAAAAKDILKAQKLI